MLPFAWLMEEVEIKMVMLRVTKKATGIVVVRKQAVVEAGTVGFLDGGKMVDVKIGECWRMKECRED